MNVLIFAGAGTSVKLGVPAMRTMAERLSEHLLERHVAPELTNRLTELLKDPNYDIEQLIEDLDHMTDATATCAKWRTTPVAPPLGLRALRQEAEWFVNHMCERIDAANAVLLWGPTLDALTDHHAVVVTTNYDRAIEISAARRSFGLYDGFGEFDDDEWTAWKGFGGACDYKLLKVHGSTDWYHSAEENQVWKLRHPMPLFGRITMQVDAPQPLKLRSAAILPSREKKMNLCPYPELAFEFRRSVDEAELAVFVGTSLRDPDMHDLYRRSAHRLPTFVVGRSVQQPAQIDSPLIIRQTASKFLAATLPTSLLSADPVGFLRKQRRELKPDLGILYHLAKALDKGGDCRGRCDAIEELAAAVVALPPTTVQLLLRDDHTEVRTFALALVASCDNRGALLAEARSIDDSAFRQELEILESLLRRATTPELKAATAAGSEV